MGWETCVSYQHEFSSLCLLLGHFLPKNLSVLLILRIHRTHRIYQISHTYRAHRSCKEESFARLT